MLGVSRLHATIAEGLLLSKTAAGRYAIDRFPAHAAIIDWAMRRRAGEAARFGGSPFARRSAMLACVEAVIADALGQAR